jgi:hypothetical protein
MLKLLAGYMLFIIINSYSFEYLINRASSTILLLLELVILSITFIFLIIKPTKKQINKL